MWCEHAGLQKLTLSRCTQISVVFGVFQRHFVTKVKNSKKILQKI